MAKVLLQLVGKLTNASLSEAKASATSFWFSNVLDPILSLSNIRHDQSFVKRHNTDLCIDRSRSD